MSITFQHIKRTGLTEAVILERAKSLNKELNDELGQGTFTLQQSVDSAIDAAIEFNQG